MTTWAFSKSILPQFVRFHRPPSRAACGTRRRRPPTLCASISPAPLLSGLRPFLAALPLRLFPASGGTGAGRTAPWRAAGSWQQVRATVSSSTAMTSLRGLQRTRAEFDIGFRPSAIFDFFFLDFLIQVSWSLEDRMYRSCGSFPKALEICYGETNDSFLQHTISNTDCSDSLFHLPYVPGSRAWRAEPSQVFCSFD